MKKRFNDVVTVQFKKCCLDRAEVRDFVDRIRDENPNVVFFRKEEIPDPATDESVLVTITGWFDYNDTSSKSRKKQSLQSSKKTLENLEKNCETRKTIKNVKNSL